MEIFYGGTNNSFFFQTINRNNKISITGEIFMNLEKFSLENKVAIITGGGTGIGKGIALEFAKAGSDVVLVSRKIENLEKVAREVQGLGRKALAIAVDIRDSDSIDNAVKQALSEFKHIDILVNNAGASFQIRPEDLSEGGWDAIMGINLKGHFLFAKAVGKVMIEQKSGNIINISSVSGKTGLPTVAHYAAAKAGLINLTKSLSIAWAKYNIRVNCIAPGYVLTDGAADIIYKDEPEKRKRPPVPVSMDRWGRPEEIGLVTVFLASDASSFITGQTIFADGGILGSDHK